MKSDRVIFGSHADECDRALDARERATSSSPLVLKTLAALRPRQSFSMSEADSRACPSYRLLEGEAPDVGCVSRGPAGQMFAQPPYRPAFPGPDMAGFFYAVRGDPATS